jgi:cytoskeleton protein RodZ
MTPTIGEKLKQARQNQKLSIKKASEVTAIRSYYIEAMEADNFDSLPSPVQARGFLRLYAGYLGIDIEDLLPSDGETPPAPAIEKITSAPAPTQEESSGLPTPSTSVEPPASVEDNSFDPHYSLPEESKGEVPESVIFPSLSYLAYDEEEQSTDFGQESQSESNPLSKTILVEIGQQLKGRRELLGLSLEEIERHTRIRKHHLKAIENGAFDELPSPVQSRGMLTAYSRFLDLDSEILLLRYADALQAARIERHPETEQRKKTSPISKPSFIQRILSTDIFFGGGLIIVMLAFAIWGAARIITIQTTAQASSNAPQSISQELLATPKSNLDITYTPTVTSIDVTVANNNSTSVPEILPTIKSNAPVQVTTIITGRTWLRVSVDGKIKFEKRVQNGNVFTFDGDKQIEVLIADGNLVQIIYNQKDLGLAGAPGEIINYIYTANEVLLPTATPTPVPTNTPRPSKTPVPSPTLRPSRTPKAEN